jgi:hypothetical protein
VVGVAVRGLISLFAIGVPLLILDIALDGWRLAGSRRQRVLR